MSTATHKILTSFFYDLVKAVPAGTINEAILNTIIADEHGEPLEVNFCDEDLRAYAESCARQLIQYRTKYTRKQLDAMERPHTVACDDGLKKKVCLDCGGKLVRTECPQTNSTVIGCGVCGSTHRVEDNKRGTS